MVYVYVNVSAQRVFLKMRVKHCLLSDGSHTFLIAGISTEENPLARPMDREPRLTASTDKTYKQRFII